jgi:hypothetical protein
MGRHDTRELLFMYTKEAINGICQSGKVELAEKVGEKAAVIAEAALKRNEKTLAEMQKKREEGE